MQRPERRPVSLEEEIFVIDESAAAELITE
jgi:hypothetical protein